MPKTMRVYYDAEFEERNGFVDVISMGFHREDGKNLYFVLNSFDTLSVARNDWLMKNVMSSIGHEEYTSHVTGTGQPVKDLRITDKSKRSRSSARRALLEFVEDITPEFWAWYGAYDHVALCSLFGRMVDLPATFPMFTHDIKQMAKAAGNPQLPKQPDGHHNALADARHNKVRYDYLEKLLKPTTWLITPSLTRGQQWLSHNPGHDGARIIWSTEQLRGIVIKKQDQVIPLIPLSKEMDDAIMLCRRY